jgi:hypothetical protein
MARQDTIGTHRTTVSTHEVPDIGMVTTVRYHNTDVVVFDRDKVTLNSGGWRTRTTMLRMNQTARQHGLGFRVYQKDWAWFVAYDGQGLFGRVVVEFHDGITNRFPIKTY